MKKMIIVLLLLAHCCFSANVELSAEQIFTNIYNNGEWGRNEDGEGTSGEGSSLKNTKLYIAFLEDFFVKNNIQTVVDLGCGDWEFSQYIDWNNIRYLGIDVVSSVIAKNQLLFSNEYINFVQANGLSIDLPPADLLICKDVLQFLSDSDVRKFLKKVQGFKYCLITNDVDPKTLSSTNSPIKTGGYRQIDLSKPPFRVKGLKQLTYWSGNVVKQVFLICN